jgi:hypothetical protein
LYSVYYELTASTCFEHYLFIFRRCCTNNSYFVCVLCLLAATCTQNTNCYLCSTFWRWANSARNMYRPLIHNKLNIKSASRWFYYTDTLKCTVYKTLRNACLCKNWLYKYKKWRKLLFNKEVHFEYFTFHFQLVILSTYRTKITAILQLLLQRSWQVWRDIYKDQDFISVFSCLKNVTISYFIKYKPFSIGLGRSVKHNTICYTQF